MSKCSLDDALAYMRGPNPPSARRPHSWSCVTRTKRICTRCDQAGVQKRNIIYALVNGELIENHACEPRLVDPHTYRYQRVGR